MKYFDGITWHGWAHLPKCPDLAQLAPTKRSAYALNFACAGRIQWGVNGSAPITLVAPVVWWVLPVPGMHYRFGAYPGETWDHYYACFLGPRVHKFIEGGLLPKNSPLYLPVHQPQSFRSMFDSLIETLTLHPTDNSRAVCLLENLLLQLQDRSAAFPSSPPSETRIRGCIERVRENPSHAWDFHQEAVKLHVSFVHLRRVFRQITGFPPVQYLIRNRMAVAARLLRTTYRPIKEIALFVGYEDIYHFSKFFKRHYALPPGHYRKETFRL